MNKLSVVEFKVYTDGHIGIEKKFLENYVSSYFENDLFEYSHYDDSYSYSFRRVFDTKEEAITFVNALFDSMWGDNYYIEEILPTFKSNLAVLQSRTYNLTERRKEHSSPTFEVGVFCSYFR